MRSRISLLFLFCVAVLFSVWAVEDPDLTKAKEKIKKRTEELENLLKDKRVTYTAQDPSFSKAIDFLKGKFQLEIVMDPVVEVEGRKVPVETVKNMSLGATLDLVCGDELKSSVMGEAIYVSTGEGMSKIQASRFDDPKGPTKAQEKLLLALSQFRTGVDFQNKPVKDAIAFLADKSKVKIDILPDDDIDGMTVTMAVKDASLRSLLDLVCGSRLAWNIAKDAVIVGLPDEVAERVEKERPKEPPKDAKKDEKQGAKPDAAKDVKKDDAKPAEKKGNDAPKAPPKDGKNDDKKSEKTKP